MSVIERVNCPLCGDSSEIGWREVTASRGDPSVSKLVEFHGNGASRWSICGRCGFVHQNPRPRDSGAPRSRGLQLSVPTPAEWRDPAVFMAVARRSYGEKVDWALQASGLSGFQRVFDVGAGHGGALAVFRERGLQVEGAERDEDLRWFSSEVVGLRLRPSVEVTEGAPRVDIVFNHTLEHAVDLDGAFDGVRAVLRAGGYLCTIVPTYAHNRSARARGWLNASNFSLFTDRSLDHLLARHGFEQVAHSYRGSVQEVDTLWHLARYTGTQHDGSRFREDPVAVHRYLRFIVPLNAALHAPALALRARPRLLEPLRRLVRSARRAREFACTQ